jgi:hypothetical protein
VLQSFGVVVDLGRRDLAFDEHYVARPVKGSFSRADAGQAHQRAEPRAMTIALSSLVSVLIFFSTPTYSAS